MISDERLRQLAYDPMMCNISPEVAECLRELVSKREINGQRIEATRAEAERPKVELPPIPERYKVAYFDVCIPAVVASSWQWETQRFHAMNEFSRKLIEELGAAEAERDQAKAELAEMQWKPITPDSMPKVGDEVIRSKRKYHVHEVSPYSQQWDYERWTRSEYTHYRTINPPRRDLEGKDGRD